MNGIISQRPKWMIPVIVGVTVIVVILVVVLCLPNEVQINRKRLEELEQRPIDDVQSLIYQKMDEDRVVLLKEKIQDGFLQPDDSKRAFRGCVFVGDSVTYAAYVAGYLTSDELAAYYSISLFTCDEYVQRAIDLRPECIVFNFGTNDMVLFDGNAEEFANTYREYCDHIKEQLPYVQIYIASVMAPTAEALSENEGMGHADDFNAAVSKMCSENDRVTYLDTADLAPKFENLREDDGIHFKGEFYGYWFARVGEKMFL